ILLVETDLDLDAFEHDASRRLAAGALELQRGEPQRESTQAVVLPAGMRPRGQVIQRRLKRHLATRIEPAECAMEVLEVRTEPGAQRVAGAVALERDAQPS